MIDDEAFSASQAARLLAGRRRIVEGVCQVCGQSFVGTRKRKFCSHTCAQRDHWHRKQAAKTGRGT